MGGYKTLKPEDVVIASPHPCTCIVCNMSITDPYLPALNLAKRSPNGLASFPGSCRGETPREPGNEATNV